MGTCDDCPQHSKVEQVMSDFKQCQTKKEAIWEEINNIKDGKMSAVAFYSIMSILLTIGLAIAGFIAYAQNNIAADVAKIRSDVAVNTDNIREVKADLKEYLK